MVPTKRVAASTVPMHRYHCSIHVLWPLEGSLGTQRLMVGPKKWQVGNP